MRLGIKILGPWELTADGDVLPLTGSRRIGLLTRLASSAGRVVTTDQLLTDVWGRAGRRRRRSSSTSWCRSFASSLRLGRSTRSS
ncbi:hypothetical protein ACFQ0B_17875 [Nonomuraea thailandensis]